MFSRFFIHRPIFASVISILIVIAGAVSFFGLPVSKFPVITPPVIRVTTVFPGASAQVVADTVAAPIEQQVNGVDGMLFMNSTSASDGTYSLEVTFEVGTNADLASVLVQNRVNAAEAKLPEDVKRQGVIASKRSPSLVNVINVFSPDGSKDDLFLANYVVLNVNDEVKRVKGVGDTFLVPSKAYGMRIWLNPSLLKARHLTTDDVVGALREQNVQVAAGFVGQSPAPTGQTYQYTIATLGRLTDVEQFENVIVKTGADGRITKLKDVARIELGAQSYDAAARLNGKPGAVIVVFQSPDANAVEVATKLEQTMQRLRKDFPQGVDYKMIYDTSRFVRSALTEVYKTLGEAVLLVVLVVLVFLQGWRATLIPVLTIPVSLIGTFTVMAALGFSINMLTLFGLVLAIGIVVDDAIVVVENVERNMAEHHLGPKEATERAMGEVFGAVIAISLVLMSVFIPAAFLPGITGQLYKQFALTIAVSTFFSAVSALTLSPALCGVLLKAHKPGDKGSIPARIFNAVFDRIIAVYRGIVALSTHPWVIGLWIILLGSVLYVTVESVRRVPTGFVPSEDLGFVVVNVQLPDSASQERTLEACKKIQKILENVKDVDAVTQLAGFSLISGNGPNYATFFATLSPWDERPTHTADMAIGEVMSELVKIQECQAFAFTLPAVDGVGNASGFDMRIQDRGGLGRNTLQNIATEVMQDAATQSKLKGVFTTYRANAPQLFADIDREKVKRMEVPLKDVFNTLQASMGSTYVNDFNKFGRTYQVNVQADSQFRSREEDISKLEVRNAQGKMIPLGALLRVKDDVGPERITRYNLYPAAAINGSPGAGASSGEALQVMEDMVNKKLPQGMGYEWTGLALQEKRTGNQAIYVFALAMVVVYLILAAQYESWLIPLAVIISVPLAVLGAMGFLMYRGMDNNVFTQIGLVLLVGLAAKNAILIVEFARANREKGMGIREAAIESARQRLRPILMTSFAFILGCVPLVVATGAGANARQALGTAVVGGMLGGTLLGLLFTPMLFVVIQTISEFLNKIAGKPAYHGAPPAHPPVAQTPQEPTGA